MKQKTKRIIAREGLIILSLLILAGLSLYVYSSLNNEKYKYKENGQEVEIAQQGKPIQPKIDFKPLDSPSVKSGPWEKYRTPQTSKKPSLDEIYGASGNQPIMTYEDAIKAGGVVLIPQGVIVMFPKDTSNDVMEKTIRRDFSYIDRVHFIVWDKKSNEKIDKYYDSEGNRKFESFIYKINFGEIALILILAVYPSYLLIRFIIWSIKTLKNRTGENEQ